ncbi:hypothetical protein DYBT9275_02389 [Dyadobacter sp. CECT 9275]|uniref:3-keto-alpha-glucoside-1,2-lyase/3-keto-2-hydroxy-glucal hydratase domain-containing protein n=1 Tax=Dyadobacter helix TaxID=2822344 RepID=A0A916NLC9_9BACT|nr:DUF1080 domain-containing protein [Dyadobacter sp. CECT 9275]CAG5000107.1 hypothetical protein DYBT9275_02389 [Dyadobacter sp. CECT 9275]
MKFQILTIILLLCGAMNSIAGPADRLPLRSLPLNDLSAFKPTTANWQIVGNAYADRHVAQMLAAMPGKGVLANISDTQNRGHLFTTMEHGDIELELDVMMAKESNSGIYFQGRYELQLQDSWGKKEKPKYGDIGGIYQRTDTVRNVGYEGSAPMVNASKAPGLWQHLRIIFQAPRFDGQGRKIANARFLKVYLNGSLVQDNFEVSGPTRSAGFKDEKPLGPIMIQGNHGRVAFKDIAYKLYDGKGLEISNLSLREFKSTGDSIRNYASQVPLHENTTDSISYLSAVEKEINLLEYKGVFQFPKSGDYLFKLQNGGGGMLIINRDTIVINNGVHHFDEEVVAKYTTTAGPAPFTLIHNKLIGWRKGLALYVEGPGMALHPLHAKGSVFSEPPVTPIVIAPMGGKSVIQRSFIQEAGHKRTHCLSVGTQGAASFTIDLSSGSLFQMWDGAFLETTSMWHRRGNQQNGTPLGTVITLGDELDFAAGNHDQNDKESAFRFLEYNIDNKGLPTFSYLIRDLAVADKIIPSVTERSLTRRITVTSHKDIAFRVASGVRIEELPDGSYAMHDKNYYLTFDQESIKPVLKNSGAYQELTIHVKGTGAQVIQYTLLW